jgi:catechol 2,3-dioxygenase-like lactoylglutathione lyase family enzyme
MLRVIASSVIAFLVAATAAHAQQKPDHYHFGARDEAVEMIVIVGINVKNMERSRAYYRDIIGLKIIAANPRPERTKLSFTGTQDEPVLMLIPMENVHGNTLGRVSFKVRNLEAIVKKHRAAGYGVITEPKRGATLINTHLADPDGNDVELIQEYGIKP